MRYNPKRHWKGFIIPLGCFLLIACQKQKFEVIYKSSQPDVVGTPHWGVPTDRGKTDSHSSSSPSRNHLPESVLIEVPFASQAPLKNWDALHEEACEEASLILVHHFLEGTSIVPERMEIEIQNLVSWEKGHGYKEDVTVEELGKIAQAYYGHLWEIRTDVTEQSLQTLIAKGQPVIIPAAGRDLANPYFSGEGPWYHMLVLKGYDQTGFITNDVGTKRGENYHYDYSTLIDAIHDWNGVKEEIRGGRRVVLVVKK